MCTSVQKTLSVCTWECLAEICQMAHFQRDWQLTICNQDKDIKGCLQVLSEILQLCFQDTQMIQQSHKRETGKDQRFSVRPEGVKYCVIVSRQGCSCMSIHSVFRLCFCSFIPCFCYYSRFFLKNLVSFFLLKKNQTLAP